MIGVNLARAERDTFLVEKVAREAAEAANAKRLESVEQDKAEQQISAYGFICDGRQHSHARTSFFTCMRKFDLHDLILIHNCLCFRNARRNRDKIEG